MFITTSTPITREMHMKLLSHTQTNPGSLSFPRPAPPSKRLFRLLEGQKDSFVQRLGRTRSLSVNDTSLTSTTETVRMSRVFHILPTRSQVRPVQVHPSTTTEKKDKKSLPNPPVQEQ
jgi:hypothetical protein